MTTLAFSARPMPISPVEHGIVNVAAFWSFRKWQA